MTTLLLTSSSRASSLIRIFPILRSLLPCHCPETERFHSARRIELALAALFTFLHLRLPKTPPLSVLRVHSVVPRMPPPGLPPAVPLLQRQPLQLPLQPSPPPRPPPIPRPLPVVPPEPP